MKKARFLILVAGCVLAINGLVLAQTSATLTLLQDSSGLPIAPVPGPDDQYQLVTPASAQSPPGLNYYFDNSIPPGQTFTTGSNTSGYLLTSLAVFDADNSGQLPTIGQAYLLRIYSVSGSNALLYTTYISSNNVTAYDFYWLQWTNLGLPLLPNTQYAYSFGRVPSGSGWANLGNTNGNPYPGGQVALIPPSGGAMTFSSDNTYDASFDVGLSPATKLTVGPPIISPGFSVTNGTLVTLTAEAAGPGPLYYQWQTDGGSGGALTNIPTATGATLALNTTGWLPGVYRVAVLVSNSTTTVASPVVVFSIPKPAAAATLTDSGLTFPTGPYDISQLTGGGTGDGLNYYDDNGANHGYYTGQTFTTGTNSQGYYLTSVAINTGAGGSSGTGTAQPYDLFIYAVNGSFASLLAHYTNASFSFTFGDWLVWSGFSVRLNPNTTYAYSFGRSPAGTGWAGLNNSPTNTDLYPGGQMCLIPASGGLMTFGRTGNSDAVFDVGLLPIGVGPSPLPFAKPVSLSPSPFLTAGIPVTLTEATTNGAPPLHYQWQTDGGSGGALTNIPNSDRTNLVVDTTGWKPGAYRYDVIVNNNYGSSTSAVVTVTILYANASATLSDIGATVPAPLPDDIAQLNVAPGGQPPGFNYYFDNAQPPGQTFTTGSNPNGYVLSTVAIDLDDNSGQLPAGGQAYLLRFYTLSGGTNATLYAVYTSQTNFIIASTTDWLRWSGLALPLAPNTTYAYTLARTTSGWARLANTSGDPYPNGQAVEIPTIGGAIRFSSDSSYDATFVLGMALAGYPVVSPPAFSPTNVVYAGTPVTATANVAGTGPFSYQWQSDGGTGVFSDIPNATNATLAIDTTALNGVIAYDLVVANASGATTSEVSQLTVQPASLPFFTSDITNSLYQPSSQVVTFVGGSVTFSDTSFQGTQPIAYQWQTDGGTGVFTNIPGATSPILTLTNLQVSNSGNYQLVATNSQGSGQTSAANLTVLPQPTNSFVVNFQFHTYVNADVGNYTGPGILGTGSYWNQVNGPTTTPTTGAYFTSSSGYSDDGLTNRGISWTVFSDNSWGYLSPPNNALLDSAANAYGTNHFLFTLPNGIYNLVLFSCGGNQAVTNGQGTLFTVNGVSQTAWPTTDTSFILNNNYVVFSNLAVSGNSLAGTWSRLVTTGNNSYGSLNGAQLQYLGPLVLLSLQPAANHQLQLNWSQGTLLQATNIAGPWVTNPATPPYVVTPTNGQMFFRVKIQ